MKFSLKGQVGTARCNPQVKMTWRWEEGRGSLRTKLAIDIYMSEGLLTQALLIVHFFAICYVYPTWPDALQIYHPCWSHISQKQKSYKVGGWVFPSVVMSAS